ncbi:cation-dependent mannose-6-phosphate receptor-like isoform X2 [Ptychodera flava]|uniref:cation-dependent mannose-6-phosphate receptor-like isoform X1 n=1 Tax=Ptychodera flava TaxID=63121 RepID=UPI003969F2FE
MSHKMETAHSVWTGRELRIFSLFAILLLQQVIQVSGDCKKINSCSCSLDDGQHIDLKALANNDGTARFKDLQGPDSFYYSYNPCNDFSESGDCTNVAACQKTTLGVGGQSYDLGNQASAEFITEGSDLYLKYTGSGKADPTVRTSKVKITCTQSGGDILVVQGEKDPLIYSFELMSPECCPKSGGGGGGLSAGTVLCIIFLVLVTVYFVGGILYMKFAKQAAGLDLIPNREFWVSLPGLIKDGILFVVSPCRKGSTPYDEI